MQAGISLPPNLSLYLRSWVTGTKKAIPGLGVSRDSPFPFPSLLLCAPWWELQQSGHPAQSRCAETFHSFQDHFSSWKSIGWFWIIVLVVSLQRNFKIHFGKAREYKTHRFSTNISFTLTSGALPYFLCVSWEVQLGHKYKSFALTELHHLPSAEHLACGV